MPAGLAILTARPFIRPTSIIRPATLDVFLVYGAQVRDQQIQQRADIDSG